MLFLFNKAKIISYIISIFTVVALFIVADNISIDERALQVVANIEQEENDR